MKVSMEKLSLSYKKVGVAAQRPWVDTYVNLYHFMDWIGSAKLVDLNSWLIIKMKKKHSNRWKNTILHEMYAARNITSADQFTETQHGNLMLESIEKATSMAKQQKKVFFFKGNRKLLGKWKWLMPKLKKMVDVTFFSVLRWNALDRCSCMVRDCFWDKRDNSMGYPVVAKNGTRTDLCFQRRHHPEIKTKAKFINNGASRCIDYVLGFQHKLKSLEYPYESSEKIFEFETSIDDAALQRWVDAWVKLMRHIIGKNMDRAIIEKELALKSGSRSSMVIQRDNIYHFRKVKKEVEDAGHEGFICSG